MIEVLLEIDIFLKGVHLGIIPIGRIDMNTDDELDIVVLVNSDISKSEFMIEYISGFSNLSVKYNILINCFPIFEFDYLNPSTMFLKNLSNYKIYFRNDK